MFPFKAFDDFFEKDWLTRGMFGLLMGVKVFVIWLFPPVLFTLSPSVIDINN